MKTFRNCWHLCLLSCVLLSAGLHLSTAAPAVESGKAKLLFKNPPREYSTGPLWVWNDLLTEQQIRETLRDLAKQGINYLVETGGKTRVVLTGPSAQALACQEYLECGPSPIVGRVENLYLR